MFLLFFIFFKIVLSIPGPLHFHINFRVNLSVYSNIQLALQMSVVLNLWVNPDSFVANPGPWTLPSADADKRPDEISGCTGLVL